MERLPNLADEAPTLTSIRGPYQGLNAALGQLSRMRGAHVSPLTVALQL